MCVCVFVECLDVYYLSGFGLGGRGAFDRPRAACGMPTSAACGWKGEGFKRGSGMRQEGTVADMPARSNQHEQRWEPHSQP